MATLTVGPGSGFEFQTLGSAVAAAQDGDTIEVLAGTYTNDFAEIDASITIVGIGGMVTLAATTTPLQEKGILLIGNGSDQPNVTLENIAFTGAAISNDDGGNAAGIRYQSGDLTLDHTYFLDNQDGLLSAPDSTGTITIENSAFIGNGNANPPDTGIEHNLYVGDIAQLTIENSYFDNPIVGHDIKSRAENNTIVNNRIYDQTGSGSYEIDLPNGGSAIIEGNTIEKGPNAGNSNFISIGEEGNVNPTDTLIVSGNTVIDNDFGRGTALINATGQTATITGNTFYGLNSGQVVQGSGTQTNNSFDAIASAPALDTSAPYLPILPAGGLACFAAGTRIATPDGPIPVEALRIGQPILTLHPEPGTATIQWIGHRRIDLDRHPDPKTAAPIRIEPDAFADGAPNRDLYLSPDHAIPIGNRLIPIRLLINNATIRRDNRRSVHYFHVELERHTTLLADGLEVETYLDTGNRGIFENAPTPLILHPLLTGQSARNALSCLPLETRAAEVKPIWWRLARRAALLGHTIQEPRITQDPQAHLWTGHDSIWPDPSPPGVLRFTLPRATQSVHLVSRATAPCDVEPWVEDRRTLGLAVATIRLYTPTGMEELAANDPSLTDGWWAPETDGSNIWRWTSGDAHLPAISSVASVEIRLAGETSYLTDRDWLPPHRQAALRR
jgi:hypothetical protein